MSDTFRSEQHYAELFSHLRIMRKALREIAYQEPDVDAWSVGVALRALKDCETTTEISQPPPPWRRQSPHQLPGVQYRVAPGVLFCEVK